MRQMGTVGCGRLHPATARINADEPVAPHRLGVRYSVCAWVLLLAAAGGAWGAEALAAAARAESPSKRPVQQAPNPYNLRAGDLLRVTVYPQEDLSITVRVSQTGTIRVPLAGRIECGSRSCTEVEEAIAQGLTQANIKDPEVVVSVDEYAPRMVYVLGEVRASLNSAFQIPLGGRVTVMQAIGMAGGVSEKADLRSVFVRHRNPDGAVQSFRVDVAGIMAQGVGEGDVELQPDDEVVVARAEPVSVLGMVQRADSFQIDTSHAVSIMEMVSRAGGFRPSANRDSTLLLRRDAASGKVQSKVVKLGETMRGLDVTDVTVQPGDIIVATQQSRVYVLGSVNEPGAFECQPEDPLTVSRAIALARGAERPKSLEDIRIVRGGTVYRVDLSGMVSGKLNSDMPLQPGDVVYVPETRW